MKIGVVIVTYNRLEKLKESLSRFELQSYKPTYILVVDNASTDGTKEYLDSWKSDNKSKYNRIVIHQQENLGGSGGFYIAFNEAIKENAEWIWVSDDDAFPEENTLKEVNDFLEKEISEHKTISAICTSVYNEGRIDAAHRRRIKKGIFAIKESYVDINEYNKEYFELDEFSYVGVVVNREILKKVGSTRKEFFINQDDTEHSLRMRQVGDILCVPSIVVNHNTGHKKTTKEVTWKRYYEIRNRYFAYKYIFPKRYSTYYYLSTIVKYYYKRMFHLRSNDELAMYKQAINDIKNNRLGMNEIYKPGWKYKG